MYCIIAIIAMSRQNLITRKVHKSHCVLPISAYVHDILRLGLHSVSLLRKMLLQFQLYGAPPCEDANYLMQIVEAFFELEHTLESTLIAVQQPNASAQVQMLSLRSSFTVTCPGVVLILACRGLLLHLAPS